MRGLAGPDQHRFDPRPEVVDRVAIAEVMQHSVHRATNSDEAARPRRRVLRMQHPTNEGARAIGADEHVAFGRHAIGQFAASRRHHAP